MAAGALLIREAGGLVSDIDGGQEFLSSGNILSAGLQSWIDLYLVNGLFDTVGQIFVRSLKLLVVPLVFVSLVCGVASLGNNSRMGVVASKTVALYMTTTALAIALAVTVASIVQPGVGVDLAMELEQLAFAVAQQTNSSK